MNLKRVHRLRKEEGLVLPLKRPIKFTNTSTAVIPLNCQVEGNPGEFIISENS